MSLVSHHRLIQSKNSEFSGVSHGIFGLGPGRIALPTDSTIIQTRGDSTRGGGPAGGGIFALRALRFIPGPDQLDVGMLCD